MARRTPPWPVARGPVPRDPTTRAKNARRQRPFSLPTEAWRGTGPRPTGSSTLFFTVARGTGPRDPTTYAKTERQPRPFPVQIEAWRGTGPRPTVKGDGLDNRSAGDRPPRAFDPREKRTPTNAVFPIEAWRGTGPRPTVKGGGLAYRSAGALGCHTRIRAGFPRDRSREKYLFRSFGITPRSPAPAGDRGSQKILLAKKKAI